MEKYLFGIDFDADALGDDPISMSRGWVLEMEVAQAPACYNADTDGDDDA